MATQVSVTQESPAEPSARAAAGAAVRMLPTATLVALGLAEAWRDRGSIAAPDWLAYAVVAALLLAVVAVSGAALALPRRTAIAACCLVALAGWDAISLTWSPSPQLARDEALLTVLYAAALLVPALSLRSARDRLFASAALVAGLGAIAVATGVELATAPAPGGVYLDARLDFPISYPNGQAALFLVGAWPALVLAARRELPVVARALSLGAAAGLAGGWLLTQSRGGALGLAVSTLVVLAVGRHRLRLVPPLMLAAGLVGAAFLPLTAPYRAVTAETAAIQRAGIAELSLIGAAVLIGFAYAALDRRVAVPEELGLQAGRALVLLVAASISTSTAVFFAQVHDPADFFAARWASFKHPPAHDNPTTHLLSLGSNRYDTWRVALDEFRAHPVAGIGARGFRAAYLQHRRTSETPARAHSLELDALSETGIVGFGLLALGLGLACAAFARRARDDLVILGALGAFACWLTQASVDWTWTFPAIGLPLFALLGIAAARDDHAPLRVRGRIGLSAASAALAFGGFGVPWLAAHYVDNALSGAGNPQADLSRARELDPLSVDPLLAQWALAPTPRDGIAPLVEAVRMEPRSADLLYALGRQELLAGHPVAARRTLLRALRLDPRDPAILRELAGVRAD